MKVVLSVPWYIPESVGGTELYVSGLSEQLSKLGVKCVVAVPSGKSASETEIRGGVRVVRFPGPPLVQRAVNSILDSVDANEFGEFLANESPDIYHQHEWSANCGMQHIRRAKDLDICTVITFHLPKIVCRNNTMMLNNTTQCDGEVIDTRCAACTLMTRGAPPLLARTLASVPSGIGTRLSRIPKIGRAFDASADARNIISGIRQVAKYADKIVTVSRWQKNALERNGVPPSKISHIVSGVGSDLFATPMKGIDQVHSNRSGELNLRIGFLGRSHAVKGLHVLIDAITKSVLRKRMTLTALTIVQETTSELTYIENIRAVANKFGLAMNLEVNQPRSRVEDFFRQIDILAVPSQWTENSPLVIWEAYAWKVPVIGSRLGGVAELVKDGVDGILVDHKEPRAWAAELDKLVSHPERIATMKDAILPVRTLEDTARDTLNLYNDLLPADRRYLAQ